MESTAFTSEFGYMDVSQYVRFRRTLVYIKQKDDEFLSGLTRISRKEKLKELSRFIGYPDYNFFKFLRGRELWLKMEGKIPERYFIGIGVDFDVLNHVLGLDMKEFDYAASLPVYPKRFTFCTPLVCPKELTTLEYEST